MSTRCVTPFYKKLELVKGVQTGYIPFPCGKCPPCVRRRVSGWAFRLNKQSEQSNSAHFVTLTYNDEHITKTKNGLDTLVKADLQKFFKRLRKLTKEKISYYAVGEYGTDGQRPHYHIILFNANEKIVENAWTIDNNVLGNIHFGDAGDASVGYTLKYISKDKKVPMFNGDDRQKEFALMSKGLGKGYLTDQMIKWHTKGNIENKVYLPLKDGKKACMPRYYKEKLWPIKDDESEETTKNKGIRFRIGIFMRSSAEELEKALENEHGNDLERIKSEQVINDFRRMYKKAETRQKPFKQQKLKAKP
jgi:hypothetical protein